jgi:hypothetical protein
VSARRLALVVLLAVSRTAAANDQYDPGTFIGGTALLPKTSVARAFGGSVGIAMVPSVRARVGFWMPELEAIVAISDGEAGKTARDLFGLRGSMSIGWLPASWIGPFLGVGLDGLVVTSRPPAGSTHGGVTLGADVRAGVQGRIGKWLIYAVTASYVGAVAPGIGDNSGGLVVGASMGWRWGDGTW